MDEENERLRKELGDAYRALRGLYSLIVSRPTDPLLGYHSMTIAAAIRFVNEGALDGAGYFEGKSADVLHDVLRSAR